MTNNMQGNPIRLSADFSTETLQVRREWDDRFKVTCKSMANSCQCMTKTTTIKKNKYSDVEGETTTRNLHFNQVPR